jgi:acetyl esterase/lipase/sugar lactone lactonase YvrE
MMVVCLVAATDLLAGEASSPVNKSQAPTLFKGEFGLCDGPSSSGGTLYVPDVKAKKLFSYNFYAKEGQGPWKEITSDKGAFSGTFYQLGELYIADNSGSRILKTTNGVKLDELAVFADKARPNDLTVDGFGHVFTTMSKEGQIRLTKPDGTVSTVAEGIDSPNGIILSPDGKVLYVSLYKEGKILAYDVAEDRSLKNQRVLATMTGGEKGPLSDGMCIDRAGNVYCAGGEAIWIWNPAGTLLDKIVTPERPINCAFGGIDSMQLYISTFGGLYVQPMNAYGVMPTPPMSGPLAQATPSRVTTEIPANVKATLDVTYYQVGTRKVLMDMYEPRDSQAMHPTILIVHGGAWLKGDKKQFRAMAVKFANKGYVVAVMEYRLGHEEKFPAAIQDCFAAVEFLHKNAATYHIDTNRIGAVGASAGGHLVGLLSTGWDESKLYPADHDPSIPLRIKAGVVMAGPMEIATGSVEQGSHRGGTSSAVSWLGTNMDDHPDQFHLADAHEKITSDDPPILFLRGGKDNPQSDINAMKRLQDVGVWTKQILHGEAKHGHWSSPEWMDRTVEDIDQFMQEKLKK